MAERKAVCFAAIVAIAAIISACSTTGGRSASAGSATDGAREEANYVARTEKDEEQLICRRERPTGSRISEKVCLTAEDWDKIERQSQEMLDRATRKAQQYPDQN